MEEAVVKQECSDSMEESPQASHQNSIQNSPAHSQTSEIKTMKEGTERAPVDDFIEAACSGDSQKVLELLRQNADVNQVPPINKAASA